jgi:hypothetical protein
MKFKVFQKIIGFGFVLAFALLSFSCDQAQTPETQEAVKAQTPSEAYRFLYAAVKAKNFGKIKQLMSNNTLTFAGLAMEQQQQSLEKVLENGMTATTFAGSLPEIRDERVNGNFGAVEVFNQKDNRWDDLSFVLEDGGWKLAFGDIMQGTYKSPGKGQAQLEMEANSPMGNIPNSPETNTNNKLPRDKTGKVETAEVPIENTNKTPAKANKK